MMMTVILKEKMYDIRYDILYKNFVLREKLAVSGVATTTRRDLYYI